MRNQLWSLVGDPQSFGLSGSWLYHLRPPSFYRKKKQTQKLCWQMINFLNLLFAQENWGPRGLLSFWTVAVPLILAGNTFLSTTPLKTWQIFYKSCWGIFYAPKPMPIILLKADPAPCRCVWLQWNTALKILTARGGWLCKAIILKSEMFPKVITATPLI